MIKRILNSKSKQHSKRTTTAYFKDEEVELIKIFNNFYGMFCRIKRKDGTIEEVRPKDITLIKE